MEVPEHIRESAEWWAENNRRYWSSRKVLLDWVSENGPVRLEDGRMLGYMPDGQSWDSDEVKAVMPALIKSAQVTVEGQEDDVMRALDMVLEEFPSIQWDVKRTVDKRAADAVIRAGGEAAERLSQARVARNKLGVR